MNLSGAKKLAIRSTATLMAVWLSGIMFLFCCAEMNAAPPAESAPSANLSAHCDKAPVEQAPGDVASSSEETCSDCCGFIPLVFDKARKIELDQKQLATVVLKPQALRHELPAVTTRAKQNFALPAYFSNKQDSYLVNRTFRI